MKLVKYVWILCLVCVIAGNASVYAAEGTDFIWELLKEVTPEDVEFGETVVLADELQFSIPADWERSAEYDDEEMCSFQFKGTDAEGRNIMFVGVEGGSESLGLEFSSYTEMRNVLVEAETSHIVSCLNGIDMIFAGDNELVTGLCLTKNGNFFAFGFGSKYYDLEAIRESGKLKADMTAILHSMEAIDEERLMNFDSSIWK